MDAVLAGLGALVGAVAAAAVLPTHTTRAALLAMAAALVASPLALSPPPTALPLAFWIVSALLATLLLLRSDPDPWARVAPLPLTGWPEAVFVLAAFALGLAVAPVAGAGRGAPSALAAGLALTAGAIPLLGFARDPVRTAIGTILLLDGVGLVTAGLGGTPGAAQIAALALTVVAAAAAAREMIAGPLADKRQEQEESGPSPAFSHEAGALDVPVVRGSRTRPARRA
ncbi:MAG: hypothetical protein ACLQBX_04275 [Candidatus Limnocylindrales bacterium]